MAMLETIIERNNKTLRGYGWSTDESNESSQAISEVTPMIVTTARHCGDK